MRYLLYIDGQQHSTDSVLPITHAVIGKRKWQEPVRPDNPADATPQEIARIDAQHRQEKISAVRQMLAGDFAPGVLAWSVSATDASEVAEAIRDNDEWESVRVVPVTDRVR